MAVYNVTSIALIDLLKSNDLDRFSDLTGLLYNNYDLIVANCLVEGIHYYVVYESKLYQSHNVRVNLLVPRSYYELWNKLENPLLYVRVPPDIENKLHLKIQSALTSQRKKFEDDTWKFRKFGSKLVIKYLGLRCKVRCYSPEDNLYTDFKTVTN